MKLRKGIQSIFFGNYFYGICAVMLSIEASLQQRFSLNKPIYYVLVFCLCSWYYTKAYITEESSISNNDRLNWYVSHKALVNASQAILLLTGISILIIFAITYRLQLFKISIAQLILLAIFPVLSAFYYGINNKLTGPFNLRNIGWMKPFLIGFIWAGMVSVYPVLFNAIINESQRQIELIQVLLFIKNFIFISVLCIMFDIKDYAMDYNQKLKTFVVKTGLRKTIFYILIPLCIAGLGSFLAYGLTQHFSPVKIILNTIPFLLNLLVAYSLHKRKSILYYLILIDGLMLTKAICGIIAMKYF